MSRLKLRVSFATLDSSMESSAHSTAKMMKLSRQVFSYLLNLPWILFLPRKLSMQVILLAFQLLKFRWLQLCETNSPEQEWVRKNSRSRSLWTSLQNWYYQEFCWSQRGDTSGGLFRRVPHEEYPSWMLLTLEHHLFIKRKIWAKKGSNSKWVCSSNFAWLRS